jgi:hypothetical protein
LESVVPNGWGRGSRARRGTAISIANAVCHSKLQSLTPFWRITRILPEILPENPA